MEALANVDQLADRLGRTLTDTDRRRAAALLIDASAKIRNYTLQTISRATTTIRLEPRRYAEGTGVYLTEWPIVEITEAVNDDADPVELNWVAGPFLLCTTPLTVTYTHGYLPIPDDLVAAVCQIAGRAFGTNPVDAGTTSESLGSYSYGTGTAAAAGPLGMLDDERKTINRYRRPSPPISMIPNRVCPNSVLTDFA